MQLERNPEEKALAEKKNALEKFEGWARTASTAELSVLTAIGFAINLALAPADSFLLFFDEMILGALPVLTLFEVVRRGTGWDVIGKVRGFLRRLPDSLVAIGALSLIGGMVGADIGLVVPSLTPVVGTPALAFQALDGYLAGLLTLLLWSEWQERRKRGG